MLNVRYWWRKQFVRQAAALIRDYLRRMKSLFYPVNVGFVELAVVFFLVFPSCQPHVAIHNPYATVDWEKDLQVKANLHTHTTRSDGSLSPQSMVDLYHEHGYRILSITDHNTVTYPWDKFTEMQPSELCRIRNEYAVSGIEPEESRYRPRGITPEALVFEDRSPSDLGMVAIQGNEITLNTKHRSLGVHDMGSYFNDLSDNSLTGEETLRALTEKNGLAMFMHPGRYDFSTGWYLDFYRRFDGLVGLELYNRGDTKCLEVWDSLLVNTMPERPIWGFSNDDTHTLDHFGKNYSVLILPELSEAGVRRAMEQGQLFYVYGSRGGRTSRLNPPVIESIRVDARKGILAINATGHDSIVWLSAGKRICQGGQIDLDESPDVKNYIRAVLYAEGGKTLIGTQPFGIRR